MSNVDRSPQQQHTTTEEGDFYPATSEEGDKPGLLLLLYLNSSKCQDEYD